MIWIVLIFLLLTAFVWKKKKPAVAITTTPPPVVATDEHKNGATIHLALNQTHKIRLNGNPTTGYMWRTVSQKGHSVEIVSDWTFHRNDAPKEFVGVPGIFELEVRAIHPGRTDLYFIYERATDAPEIGYSHRFTFLVDGPIHQISILDDKKKIRLSRHEQFLITLPATVPGFHWTVLRDDGLPLLQSDSHRFLYTATRDANIKIAKIYNKTEIKSIFQCRIDTA